MTSFQNLVKPNNYICKKNNQNGKSNNSNTAPFIMQGIYFIHSITNRFQANENTNNQKQNMENHTSQNHSSFTLSFCN